MADQSTIQSLLQQLAGTASAGQANLPSNVNNGNPNTIYNQPLKQGGYLPPVTNGFDQWRINPAPPTTGTNAPINWQQLAANAPGNHLASILPKYPAVTPAFGSFGGGTGTPPVIPGLPPAGGGGGPTLPPTDPAHPGSPNGNGPNTFLGKYDANSGVFKAGSGNGWGVLGLPAGDITANFSSSSGGGNMSKGDILGSLSSLGGDLNVSLGSFGQSLSNTAIGQALGITPSGDLNMMQALDWVLPGNLYMSQTGQTNFANIIPALFHAINPVLGFAVAKVMDAFGAKYANTDDSQLNWLQKLLKNRYNKNKANRNARNRGGSGNGTRSNPFINQGGTYMGGSFGFTGAPTGNVSVGDIYGYVPASTPDQK